jgi:hypothetical protein
LPFTPLQFLQFFFHNSIRVCLISFTPLAGRILFARLPFFIVSSNDRSGFRREQAA